MLDVLRAQHGQLTFSSYQEVQRSTHRIDVNLALPFNLLLVGELARVSKRGRRVVLVVVVVRV